MITSREDYEFYLEADKIALGIEKHSWWEGKISEIYDIWHYERLLRKLEYYMNCKPSRFWQWYKYYLMWKLKRAGFKLNFSISPNVFGPGLSIAHIGPIIVNGYVRVGENCRINSCVHLATQAGSIGDCPSLGNNIFIGPGTVIFGNIEIADEIVIGSNSVVNRSIQEKGITIAGIPAKKISDKGFDRAYYRATNILRTQKLYSPKLMLGKSKLTFDNKNSKLKLVVKNDGQKTWTNNTLLRIGTSREKDRNSTYYNSSWISMNRICSFSEDEVPPGANATFNFTVSSTNSVPSEKFQLVLENICWFPDTEFKIRSGNSSFIGQLSKLMPI